MQKLDPSKSLGTDEQDDDEEQAQIRQHEKSVNIRFGNYSMMMRASQYGISSKLLSLLSSVGSTSGKNNNKDLLDACEGKTLSAGKKENKDWD